MKRLLRSWLEQSAAMMRGRFRTLSAAIAESFTSSAQIVPIALESAVRLVETTR
ncbi:hypothetical protein ABEW34_04770 [Paenibacillus algorifonticola]|uniref:hypothetical protein n=1 Tax=Paenibacillus algorifonticola TaxID=684063 RepID=UPI003D2C0421